MKKIFNIVRLLSLASFTWLFASCGLMDFDLDDDTASIVAKMSMNLKEVYVMRGDTVPLKPKFDPDTVNITDIFVSSSDPEVVYVDPLNGRIEAVAQGTATLYVQSVSARLQDSCTVHVMQRWDIDGSDYPYETVFHADVTFGGKALTEDMTIAAFINDECRGVGEVLTFHGISFIQLRVGAEKFSFRDGNIPSPSDPDANDDDDDDDDVAIYRDQIQFRLYDRKTFKVYIYPQLADFDGETHGTLSNLYKLTFE